MTGPEHYTEAERLLEGHMYTAAQVHATLALAAATALAGQAGSGMALHADRKAWINTASEYPGEQKRIREASRAEQEET